MTMLGLSGDVEGQFYGRIIMSFLSKTDYMDKEEIMKATGLDVVQYLQGIVWLQKNDLVELEKTYGS